MTSISSSGQVPSATTIGDALVQSTTIEDAFVQSAAIGDPHLQSATVLQSGARVLFDGDVATVRLVAGVLALALAAAAVAAGTAFLYRWYSGQSAPDGVPILLGLSLIAISLNTTDILRESLVDGGVVADDTAVVTVATFVAGTVAADAGRRLGEHVAAGLPSVQSVRGFDADVGQLVRAAGRVVRVTVPEVIEDIDGYEPVPEDVKADLAGATFLFPRRLTVVELRERFADRLQRDYDVGHVDVELAADGSVEYLALGRRLAGIGQTLPPGVVAVAIRADPAFTATPGDRVQVWRDDGEGDPRRVVTGELRAVAGDAATVVVDEGDAAALSDDVHYRLVTLPDEVQPDREFATLLRSADETMAAIPIRPDSELDGVTIAAIGELTVAAVSSGDDVDAIPERDRPLAAGDTVYVVGRLDAIRRLEPRAASPSPASDAEPSDSGGATATSTDG